VHTVSDITERRRAEERIRKSEQQFRLLAEAVEDVFWISTPDVAEQIYVSPVYEKIWGRTLQELTEDPRSFVRAIHPEDIDRYLAVLDGPHTRGEPYACEYRIVRPGGAIRWILERGFPVRGEDGRVTLMAGVCTDITERKATETRLRFQAMLLDEIRDTITATDLEGRITYVNEAECRTMGRSREELLGLSVLEYGEDPARGATQGEIIETTRTKGEWRGEVVNRLDDGSEVILDCRTWLISDEEGHPSGMCGIATDITERKSIEEALRASESLYRMLVESTNSFVFVLDPEGFFRFVNRFWSKKVGYAVDEIVGTSGFDLIAPECIEYVKDNIARALAGDLATDIEFRSRTKDGGFIDVSVNMVPVFDSSGLVSQLLGTGVDITERKRAEEERAYLEEQYRQAQKMEAIGHLTGGVAHDFNNLLQVIQGGTDLAMEDLEAEHPAHDSLAEVIQASERAARLVSQLLLFSRRQIMRPEYLNLDESVADLLKMVGRVIGEHIQLEWRPGLRDGTIHADRGMIEQALMNLCVNARDAMPEGGTLTIETQEMVADEEFHATHSWATPGRYALLSVSDTGCGMDEATIEHIFEPFYSTKEVGKGTGLGLATVYGIIKQHDGMINAYSEPGKGSTFKLYWPMTDAGAEQADHVPELPVSGGTETILLAEDDEMVRSLAMRVLRRAGYTILVASDGAEAVALFEARAADIDMVILDVVMPKLGGRAAFEHMKQQQPGLKALFASGYSEDAIHTNFVLDQGLSLIQKPFTRDEILKAVRNVLDQARP